MEFDIMRPPLGERLAMLTYSQSDLAREAQVNRRTINDLVNGKRMRGPTPVLRNAVEGAISAHEMRVRDYLIAIHGLPSGEGSQ